MNIFFYITYSIAVIFLILSIINRNSYLGEKYYAYFGLLGIFNVLVWWLNFSNEVLVLIIFSASSLISFVIAREINHALNSRVKKGNKKLYKPKNKDEFKFSRSSKSLILLIEDEQDMLDLIAGYLENDGFDVLCAQDSISGQALALQYSPDIVLLDLMLPNVDGLTLCERLRRDERTSSIPLLMITALGGLKDCVTSFNSGPDDFITKPFDLEDLSIRIKFLLRRTNRK